MAYRRDFTINALFYDPLKSVIKDYTGGLADVERRVIRSIGDPKVRFREDPIRMLRAIKFAARLDLNFDDQVKEAMRGGARVLGRGGETSTSARASTFSSRGVGSAFI